MNIDWDKEDAYQQARYRPYDPSQLPDWATPLDFGDQVGEDDATVGDFWNRKSEEADMEGMQKSISKHGVINPVRMYEGGLLRDGTHRIAAAMDVDPQIDVPIFWIDSPEQQPETWEEKDPDGRWLPDVNRGN